MANEPAPEQPTEFQKFLVFTKKVVAVPKAEIDRREAEYQRMRSQKKAQRGKS